MFIFGGASGELGDDGEAASISGKKLGGKGGARASGSYLNDVAVL